MRSFRREEVTARREIGRAGASDHDARRSRANAETSFPSS